jgi:hypothetical protein
MEFAIGAQELTNGEQDKAAQDKVFQESWCLIKVVFSVCFSGAECGFRWSISALPSSPLSSSLRLECNKRDAMNFLEKAICSNSREVVQGDHW